MSLVSLLMNKVPLSQMNTVQFTNQLQSSLNSLQSQKSWLQVSKLSICSHPTQKVAKLVCSAAPVLARPF